MAGFSNYLEGECLKLLTGQTLAISPPITPYVALFTVAPADNGTGGTEVSGGSYARVDAAGLFAAPVLADPSTVANNASISFGTATASWGTVVAFGIYTASTSGTMLASGLLTTAMSVNNGNPVSFASGLLVCSLD